MSLRPLIIFGTRPECIKLALVIRECLRRPDRIQPIICSTGQHREMLQPLLDYFQIPVDRDLSLMSPGQSLGQLTSRCLLATEALMDEMQPDCLIVQGDTTSVLSAAMAAFYRRLPIVHVEAGLRTGNRWAPWPEEFNRHATSLIATWHCAPTPTAAENLYREGIDPARVHVTGNTGVDALLFCLNQERTRHLGNRAPFSYLGDHRMVLVTAHRRESFGPGVQAICDALTRLTCQFPNVWFVFCVHPNPRVREPVLQRLSGVANLALIEPVPYPEFVWLMDRCHVILSDSGGVQEEAPSLQKPVLLMRDSTERPEAVQIGAVELVGTDSERIVRETTRLLTDETEYHRRQVKQNPFGDGQAAVRIVDLLEKIGMF